MNKKSSQKLPATKEDIKNLEKSNKKDLRKLEEEIKIIKVETRTFNTQLRAFKGKIWMEMDDFKHEIKDGMSLLRNDMAEMKDEIKRITSLEQPKFT